MTTIRFLGTAPGMPTLAQRHSCLWVKNKQHSFLLDCGEGVSQAILEQKIPPDEIDFIWISHFHPDHSSGIFMLLQMWLLQKRKKKLYIFLPERKEHFEYILDFFYLFTQKMPFIININSIKNIKRYFPFLVKESFPTDHFTMALNKELRDNQFTSYGVKLSLNQKLITYTSDIQTLSKIRRYLKRTDILIADAIHPSANEFIEIEPLIKERIYLTHGITPELSSLIQKHTKFVIAKDKDIITI